MRGSDSAASTAARCGSGHSSSGKHISTPGRRLGLSPRAQSEADHAARGGSPARLRCDCAHGERAALLPPEAIRRTSRVPRGSSAGRRATRRRPGDRTRAAAFACAAPLAPWVSPRVPLVVCYPQPYASVDPQFDCPTSIRDRDRRDRFASTPAEDRKARCDCAGPPPRLRVARFAEARARVTRGACCSSLAIVRRGSTKTPAPCPSGRSSRTRAAWSVRRPRSSLTVRPGRRTAARWTCPG
jgi:hypothetical protein